MDFKRLEPEMMPPLVSIITVTRNLIDAGRKDCFRQCIESVRMQDYPNIEHLIIDGASTDGTIDLIRELNLDYISEPDSGIYNAFNKGIKFAKGKYIAFLNSDDFYCAPNSITSFIDAIQKEKADFTCGPVNLIDAKGKIKESKTRWKKCFVGTPFCHQTMFSSIEMLRDLNGFNEEYRILSDFDLILRGLISGKKAACLNEKFVSFRSDGISSNFNKKIIFEQIQIIETNCTVSHQQAVRAQKYGFLPNKNILFLLSKTDDFIKSKEVLRHNRIQFLRYIRKQLFTLHLRKGKLCFRLLGITFYNGEKL